jgi:hypothetical protein
MAAPSCMKYQRYAVEMNVKNALGLEQSLLFLDGQTQVILTKYAYWYCLQQCRLATARTTATTINNIRGLIFFLHCFCSHCRVYMYYIYYMYIDIPNKYGVAYIYYYINKCYKIAFYVIQIYKYFCTDWRCVEQRSILRKQE